MFSYTHPPGASVAWPPRDERQGWHLPPTRGGRCGGGVNDATAAPRATRLGKDEVDEDHRDRDGDTAAPERDPAGACRWRAERATPWRTSARTLPAGSRSVRPSGRSSNEPSPRRRGPDRARTRPGRARPSAPDVRRRACWVGAEAGRAMRATGATSRGISRADGWGELPTATGAAPMAAKPPS